MTPTRPSRLHNGDDNENIMPVVYLHHHGINRRTIGRKGHHGNKLSHRTSNRNNQRKILNTITQGVINKRAIHDVKCTTTPKHPCRRKRKTSISSSRKPSLKPLRPKRTYHGMITRSHKRGSSTVHHAINQEKPPFIIFKDPSDSGGSLSCSSDDNNSDNETAAPSIELRALLACLPDLDEIPTPPVFHDIDADTGDIMTMKDYAKHFYNYLQSIEIKSVCQSTDVNPDKPTSSMRSVLIDWLMQVQSHLNLKDETLHLTVKMIDKYQQSSNVKLDHFQLIGVSCLLLAAKYEERYAPEIDFLVHLTANSYTRENVIENEQLVWRTLNFDLCWPTSMTFLRRYLQIISVNKELTCNFMQLKTLSLYLVDLALVYTTMSHYYPSESAAAALCLALLILNPALPDVWDATMIHYSRYTERQLNACMSSYAELVMEVPRSKFQAANKKHTRPRFESVELISKLAQTPIIQDLANNETSF